MRFVFNAPFNSVSFGQLSTAIVREFRSKDTDFSIFPIQNNTDFSSQAMEKDFGPFFEEKVGLFHEEHDRSAHPAIKVWHLNGGIEFPSDNRILYSFYELDAPTDTEINIAKNCNKVAFSSEETVEHFRSKGVDAHYVPLGFDHWNFKVSERDHYDDDRIVFNLTGKFEKRKHHQKILEAWIKRFGNDPKYLLQCAIYNSFLNSKDNNVLISRSLQGEKYSNIVFHGQMKTNSEYNDFLNSSHIILGMSGGEGWGLPEFQSVALGKHAVILGAHGYKGWANKTNSVIVDSTSKIDAYDSLFFSKGALFNQGQIYDWNPDEFIGACEEAVKRVENNPINTEGLKLQEDFTYTKTADKLLSLL